MSGLAPGLVILDCDGVLVDSEPIAIRHIADRLRREGVEITDEAARDQFLGRSIAAHRAEIRRRYGLDLTEADFAAMQDELLAVFRQELKPVEGAAALLERLTIPFCVASSSRPARIETALEVTGLLPLVDGRIFSASMVAHGKPAPDLFLHAAREMGVAPDTALAVEDSVAGVEAARRAGMRAIGFTGGGHATGAAYADALRAAGAEIVVERLADIGDQLAETSGARAK